jgi:hypothetical protein
MRKLYEPQNAALAELIVINVILSLLFCYCCLGLFIYHHHHHHPELHLKA